MPARFVARHTRLHPGLWAPYRIIAYPNGFHDWPEGLADPVWTPEARIIEPRGACVLSLCDRPTLDDAIDACWAHLASLPDPVVLSEAG